MVLSSRTPSANRNVYIVIEVRVKGENEQVIRSVLVRIRCLAINHHSCFSECQQQQAAEVLKSTIRYCNGNSHSFLCWMEGKCTSCHEHTENRFEKGKKHRESWKNQSLWWVLILVSGITEYKHPQCRLMFAVGVYSFQLCRNFF